MHGRLASAARRRTRRTTTQLAAKALKLGLAATGVPADGAGAASKAPDSFLEAPEFADVERMRALFRALEEKTQLLALLDRVQRASEMQIFIGAESELSPAATCR